MSFAGEGMALGYARARPPVHRRILERVWGERVPFRHALDVGCGSGISTRALDGFAERRTGVEPVVAMCRMAPSVAPGAHFCSGSAEDLPFSGGIFDCITAAGSLNYCDIDRFFPEAARVVTADGVLLVYDFRTGRNFASGTDVLAEWYETFVSQFPYPVGHALALNPSILGERAGAGFRVVNSVEFAIPVEMNSASYLEYVLTETNVVGRGEARAWCSETLQPVWAGREAAPVIFRGYAACLCR